MAANCSRSCSAAPPASRDWASKRATSMLVLGDNRPRLYAGHAGRRRDSVDTRCRFTRMRPSRDPPLRSSEAGARFALAEDQEQVDKILDLREHGATIEHIVYDDPRGLAAYADPGLISWDALQARGKRAARPQIRTCERADRPRPPDGPAVFVHSSGTTGKPKGIVLSHSNFLAGVRNAYQVGAFGFGESILAYLPMAWVGDFAVTMGAGIALHFTINIPERQETVLHNLREIAPTFYLAAPRSWDNLADDHSGAHGRLHVAEEAGLRRSLWRRPSAAERRKLEGGQPTLRRTAAAAGSANGWSMGRSRISSA